MLLKTKDGDERRVTSDEEKLEIRNQKSGAGKAGRLRHERNSEMKERSHDVYENKGSRGIVDTPRSACENDFIPSE
jgi:hypothetical protein